MKEICPNLHNKQVAKEFGAEIMDIVQIRRQRAPTLYYLENYCILQMATERKHLY